MISLIDARLLRWRLLEVCYEELGSSKKGVAGSVVKKIKSDTSIFLWTQSKNKRLIIVIVTNTQTRICDRIFLQLFNY